MDNQPPEPCPPSATPVPAGMAYQLPFRVPADTSGLYDVLRKIDRHMANLRFAMLLEKVLEHFPEDAAALNVRVRTSESNGEEFLSIYVSTYGLGKDGKFEIMEDEDPGLEMILQDYLGDDRVFRELALKHLDPDAPARPPEGFRALADAIWAPDEQASIHAAELQASLPAATAGRPPRPRA